MSAGEPCRADGRTARRPGDPSKPTTLALPTTLVRHLALSGSNIAGTMNVHVLIDGTDSDADQVAGRMEAALLARFRRENGVLDVEAVVRRDGFALTKGQLHVPGLGQIDPERAAPGATDVDWRV